MRSLATEYAVILEQSNLQLARLRWKCACTPEHMREAEARLRDALVSANVTTRDTFGHSEWLQP